MQLRLRVSPIYKFSALQWFFWSSWATFGAFNVYHLGERGLSNSLVGMLLSIMTFSGILGQYFWGYLCDRLQTVKKVFIFCIACLALIIVFFPLYLGSPVLLAIALGLIGWFWSAQPSIIDSWTVESSPQLARNYGFTRSFGSVGFAVVASVFGRFIGLYGWNVMFYSFAALALVTIAVASTIEDSNLRTADNKRAKVDPRRLLKMPDYVLLIVAATVIFIGHQSTMIFLPAILRSVGGSPVDQGTAMSVSAVSEMPVFLLSVWYLKRFQPRGLLLFAAAFYVLRIFLLFQARSPQMVIYAGALQSLSFGVFLPTMVYYVKQIAPAGLKTTAQTIATGSYFGIGGVLGSILGGRTIDAFGVQFMLAGALLLSLTGFALFLVNFLRAPQVIEESLSRG